MRTNESEYKRLEDTIESLKAENAELTKTVQHQDRVLQMYFLSLKEQEEDVHELLEDKRLLEEDRDYYEQALRRSENIVLNYLKDKERLEWLIDNASISNLRKDENGEEWWVELDYSEPRKEIDKQMEDTQAQRPKVYRTGILR